MAIIENMVVNNKSALPEAQEFIEGLTQIVDSSNNKKNSSSNIESDKVIVDQNDLKSKLRMELN